MAELDRDKITTGTSIGPPPGSPTPDSPWDRPAVRRERGLSIVSTLIVINVAIWFVQTQSSYWNQALYGFGALQTAAVVHGEVWRLFTAQYLHASWVHLLVNMIALHFLGRPLEQRWSPRKFFAIYTACGLAGNIFFTLLGTKGVINPFQAAVGASGCIYGLLGIVAVMFPDAELLVYYVFPVRVRTAAIIMGVIAFMSVVERGANYGGEACHLAGLVFGVWWALHGDEWWSNSDWVWKRPRQRKE
ncbi:MAG TPA: rhomboid family intramembrane serine protease [Phycisphaerae bacterium]|nr:rhomboid family intramembrane serine protease [Phycisphaerae bacterium]